MDAYIKFILTLLLSFTETRADLTSLMARLNNQMWPWFGDRYPSRCPKPETDWPRCYNPRDDYKSSVLQRIGVHSDVKPTLELEVIFSAPAETVDICGKKTNLPEVKPFKLNPNGFAIKELLSQGAEIYRRMPLVKWSGTLAEEHSLLFIDAGCIKVRGYIGNVRTNGTHFLGEVLWPYTPPANPKKLRSPVVILLVQESLSSATLNQKQMLAHGCIARGISKAKLRDCLGYFSDILGADAGQMKPDIKFLNVSVSTIDMYVNLEIWSVRRFHYTACCKFVVVEPYTFRAVPGENKLVDDTAKLHRPYRLEISGSGDIALGVFPVPRVF